MNVQFDLFSTYEKSAPTVTSTGVLLKERGMKKAVDHANVVHDGWSALAHSFLVDFVRIHEGEFMAEDVREKSRGIVPAPPSSRAWGSIIRSAAMSGIIRKVGIKTVKNPTAHRANASVWRKA